MSGKARRPKNDKKPVVYWDTCIVISLIKKEQRADSTETEAIRELRRKLDAGEITVVTSAITLTEVLDSEIPDGNRGELQKLQQMPDRFSLVDVGPAEAEKAHAIRDHYKKMPEKQGKTVSTPDAIHLATAIIWECDAFYTFDEKDHDGKKTLGLLPLSGDDAVDNLVIRKPPPPAERPLGIPGEEGVWDNQGLGDV
jgi:predicted nucleic acid-binding protein